MSFKHVRYEPPQSLLLAAGVAAPIMYMVAVAVGGAITPGYSHLADPVSALLIGERAAFIEPLFLLYNVLTLCFAWGVHDALGGRSRHFVVTAAMLAIGGMLGLVMAFFPMDAVGAPISLPGGIHIVIAALMSVSSMACLVSFALGLAAVPDTSTWRGYTIVSLAIVLVSGGLAAVGTVNAWPIAGLLERVTIGAYLLWILTAGLALLRISHPSETRAKSILAASSSGKR